MPAALHILRIKIGGWKAIREDNPVEIDFQGGKKFASSALIVGPNESGKSSLFSALRFALFEKFEFLHIGNGLDGKCQQPEDQTRNLKK